MFNLPFGILGIFAQGQSAERRFVMTFLYYSLVMTNPLKVFIVIFCSTIVITIKEEEENNHVFLLF